MRKVFEHNLILEDDQFYRLLTAEEMTNFTNCVKYKKINPEGNLINSNTEWDISGTLIQKIEISENDISCGGRTLLLPIRYRTIEDAMGMCEALGERGDFLKPFEDYDEYYQFYQKYLKNPAIQKYCDNGGRYMLWLPYQGWADVTDDEVNVTYYKSNQSLMMNDAWRKNNPKSKERPYCVIARMGNSIN